MWIERQRLHNFASANKSIVLLLFVFVLLPMLIRCLFVSVNVSVDTLERFLAYVPGMLWTGLRFDAQVAGYLCLPLFVLTLFALLTDSTGWYLRIVRLYGVFSVALICVAGLSDIVWYQNFKCHFHHVLFDFFDEEPEVLVRGIWAESPIVRFSLLTIVACTLFYFFSDRLISIAHRSKGSDAKGAVLHFLFTFALLFVCCRGSLSTFILSTEDIYVSPSQQINDAVPNALTMLRKTWREHKKEFTIEGAETVLRDAGFDNLAEACQAWTGLSLDSCKDMSPADALFAQTTANPPHPNADVLIVVAESWSNRLIDYEQMLGVDLLMNMRHHLTEDVVYRRAVSSTNGTIETTQFMTCGSPWGDLFTTQYRTLDFACTPAHTMRTNGYETYFVTGIRLNWRNIGEALPHMGFDHVVGKYELLEQRPDAECNDTWGVYDHSMLNYVSDLLTEPHDQPRYIVALTSTSHTPFEFPKDYEFPPISQTEKSSMAYTGNWETIVDYLHGYQYESNEMGNLMDRLKASARRDSVVVCLTGDHNIRSIMPYGQLNDIFYKYSVPIYFYTPTTRGTQRKDTTTYCGHADIFPTIANLTLSNAQYFATGQDLWHITDSAKTMGVNTDYIASQWSGAQRRAVALMALKKIWFAGEIGGVKSDGN